MGGSDTKSTNTQQSSVTNPYAPSIPLLSNILSSLGGTSTGPTSGQTNAINQLRSEAAGIPDLSGSEIGAITGALGTSTQPQQDMLKNSYGMLSNSLSPLTNPANLNPYSTPGFSDAINTLTSDITKQVQGAYAGSGRDPSGAGTFAQSLGRGITQGVAPTIASQYNTNVGNLENAAGTLYNAGGTTASGLTQQQQAELAAKFQGLQGASGLPGLLTQGGNTMLGIENLAYGTPLQNISGVENLVNPIAALGGSSSGTGTSTTTQPQSLISNIVGGAAGLAGLNGAMGSGWLSSLGSSLGSGLFSALGPGAGFLAFSDERVKEDIEPVGETHDGQTLYSYRYVGDSEPRVGLLAQDVEKRDPGAVVEIGGIKAVNYPRALRRSAEIGMLKMAA